MIKTFSAFRRYLAKEPHARAPPPPRQSQPLYLAEIRYVRSIYVPPILSRTPSKGQKKTKNHKTYCFTCSPYSVRKEGGGVLPSAVAAEGTRLAKSLTEAGILDPCRNAASTLCTFQMETLFFFLRNGQRGVDAKVDVKRDFRRCGGMLMLAGLLYTYVAKAFFGRACDLADTI